MATAVQSTMDLRIAQEFNKRAPFKVTFDNLLVLAHVGSKSHGTYVPPDDPQAIDDVDYMGVVVPPVEYVLGIEHWEGLNFMYEELDCVFYSLQKFVRLLVKNNPNVLGMLWMRPEDYIVAHPEFDRLTRKRDAFSSLLAYHSFLGYARSQLDRMTAFDEKTTKEWDMAVAMATTAGWDVNAITDKSAALPMPNYAALDEWHKKTIGPKSWDVILAEVKVSIQRIHARHFQGYMGEKRKALVRKYGYDTKNAAHLIRLMRMCCEFLETGKLNVYREGNDARQLRQIKKGEWALQKVQDLAAHLFNLAQEFKEQSQLPPEPNRKLINDLVVNLQRSFYVD